VTSELQQTRYDKILRRVGDLKGPGSKVAEVISELWPVLDVERVPGELLALGGTFLCIGAARVLATAAVVGHVQLFNPVGSGKIITVTQMMMSARNQTGLVWGLVNVALPTDENNSIFRDPRLGLFSRATGQVRTSNVLAGQAPNVGRAEVLASEPLTIKDENGVMVLPEGTGLEASTTGTNQSIAVSYEWRERIAEPSELNL